MDVPFFSRPLQATWWKEKMRQHSSLSNGISLFVNRKSSPMESKQQSETQLGVNKLFLFLKIPPTEGKQKRSLARLGTYSEKLSHETFSDMPKKILNDDILM